jgi:hypothetical protein
VLSRSPGSFLVYNVRSRDEKHRSRAFLFSITSATNRT